MTTVIEKLRHTIQETRDSYGFPDIEKRYPGALLNSFLLKDAIELLEVIMEYENCITWDTTCKNCAKLMDKNYEQYMEIQELRDSSRAVL